MIQHTSYLVLILNITRLFSYLWWNWPYFKVKVTGMMQFYFFFIILCYFSIIHISDVIWPTRFILGTMLNITREFSYLRWNLLCQGHRSRSNVLGTKQLAISRFLLGLQTSYLVSRYSITSEVQRVRWRWLWSKVKVTVQGQMFPKTKLGHITDAICLTGFIFGIDVQDSKRL